MFFGTILAGYLVLVLLLLVLATLNWGGNKVFRFALSLDKENSPDLFKTNWVIRFLRMLPGVSNIQKDSRGRFRVVEDALGDEYYIHDTLEEAKADPAYLKTSLPHTFVVCFILAFVLDCLAVWFQWDWLSLAVIGSLICLVFLLRYISSAVWENKSDVEGLDKRVTKLEDR